MVINEFANNVERIPRRIWRSPSRGKVLHGEARENNSLRGRNIRPETILFQDFLRAERTEPPSPVENSNLEPTLIFILEIHFYSVPFIVSFANRLTIESLDLSWEKFVKILRRRVEERRIRTRWSRDGKNTN